MKYCFLFLVLALVIMQYPCSADVVDDMTAGYEFITAKTNEDFTVSFYYKSGISHQDWIIPVQNLEGDNRYANISSFIQKTNFDTDEIEKLQFFEYKLVPYTYTIDHYDHVNYSEWNETNQTWNNWTEQTLNWTETIESDKLDWKACKSNLFKSTGKELQDDYGEILIPKFGSKDKGDGTINGTKIFRVSYDTPIVRMSDGWGSSGEFAVLVDDIRFCPWWSATWDRRRAILIDNTVGDAVSDYQLISVDLTSYNINASSSRIVNESGCQQSFWNETVDASGNLERAWCNYSSLPAGSWINSTYDIYYQSSPTVNSVSDGDTTFIQYHGSTTSSYLKSLDISPSGINVIVEGDFQIVPYPNAFQFGLSNLQDASDDAYMYYLNQHSTLGSAGIAKNEGSGTETGWDSSPLSTDTHRLKMIITPTTFGIYADGVQVLSNVTSGFPDENMGLCGRLVDTPFTQNFLFVRKYTANEPEPWTVGVEEEYVAPTPTPTPAPTTPASPAQYDELDFPLILYILTISMLYLLTAFKHGIAAAELSLIYLIFAFFFLLLQTISISVNYIYLTLFLLLFLISIAGITKQGAD